MRYLALATDYDGTLAEHAVVSDDTLAALHRAKAAGVKLILVTGRELSGMHDVFDHFEVFDLMVVENGAVVHEPATASNHLVSAKPPAELVERLRARGVPVSVGESIVSTEVPHDVACAEVLRELKLDWQLIYNNSAVMLLPRGVNKASGLRAAAARLGIDLAQVVAVGDAENDLAMLEAAGLGVAMGNAIPALKSAARRVMTGGPGVGVVELIEATISGTV